MNSSSRTLLAVSLAAAVGLSGCTTLDPYTREEKTSKATTGAIIGAVAGAAIGGLSSRNDRTKRAMIGAGIGALAGAAVGNYMDQQEAELRRRLEGTGVSVTRVGDNLILNMPGNVTFAVDRDEINAGFYETLNSVALVLKKYDKTAIEIAGHTDSTGSDEYNMALSQRRAGSVAGSLAGQGVQRVRLNPIGFGERMPIADNSTPAGRAANRRVELTLMPVTQG
jgi:outer membrane protein OmpA-like peptidoglycan-associated protein